MLKIKEPFPIWVGKLLYEVSRQMCYLSSPLTKNYRKKFFLSLGKMIENLADRLEK